MNAARSVRAIFRLTIAVKAPPSCTRTPSADASKVLAYLDRLTNGTEPGVIAGQMCPQASGICDSGFQQAIEELHAVSGKWVGIMSVEYEFGREFGAGELSSANRRLSAYWQAGGLILIGWSPANPWGPDPQNAWRDVEHHYPGADLHALLPGGAKRIRWLRSLDRIAAALRELRDAGVVVLWRPMQEMNNPVYWWAKESLSDTHEVYGEVWRDMFNYFTCVKGLDNLLWAFAPISTRAYSSFPYPGDAYVDVVAGTAGDNELNIPGYDDMLSYDKPVALSEFGPDAYGDDKGANGSFDNRLYIKRLRDDYPRIAFWITPGSWPGVKLALVDNLYASELLNDPDVLTRDDLAWR
jgi:mannan endo-1,4-beta-mannosidase